MARAYTVSASCYWDDAQFGGATARQGADTYTLNDGVTLTVDTDSRTCQNSAEGTGCAGNITLTSRAKLKIDGSAVRLVPYDGGTGNVPAKGTTVYLRTGGSDEASGELLGVYDTLASAPTAAGAAMPADGFLKFRSLSNSLGTTTDNADVRTASGGGGSSIGTVNGTDKRGWIEFVGVEGSGLAVAGTTGLGTVEILGDWFVVGTTPGSPATTDTYQLPAPYDKTYYAGVWVETSSGSGTYDLWPVAGIIGTTYQIAANTLATDKRGRVCWISSQGLLRFGYDGTNTGGELPGANCKIRVPNVILSNTTSAATTAYTVGANSTLNTTVTSRYKNNGVSATYSMSYFNSSWYFVPNGPAYSMSHYTHLDKFTGTVSFGAVLTLSDGIQSESGYIDPAFNYTTDVTCNWGVDFTDVVFAKLASANTNIILRSVFGGTLTRCKFFSVKARTAALIGCYVDASKDIDFIDCTAVNSYLFAGSSSAITYTDTVYCDTVSGSVGTSNAHTIFNVPSVSGVVIDGLSWLIATANTCHPRMSIASVGPNSKIKNIGTYASPLSLGTVSTTQGFVTSTLSRHKFDRIYLSDATAMTYGAGMSLYGLYASDVRVTGSTYVSPNPQGWNRGSLGDPNVSNNSPGGHLITSYTSTTAGWVGVSPTYPMPDQISADVFSYGTGVTFVSDGAVLTTVDDHWCLWKFPSPIRGFTAFNGAPTIRGATTPANFYIEVSFDEGATWVKAKGTDGTTSLTAYSVSSSGFGLWVRVICKAFTTLAAAYISSIRFPMTTDATAVQTQYPLEEITFTDSGSLDGSTVAWINPGGASVFDSYTKSGAGQTVRYDNEDGTEKTGTYRVRKAGYAAVEGTWVETTSWYRDTKTYYVSQSLDEATTNAAVTGVSADGATTTLTVSPAGSGAITLAQLYQHAQYWSCIVDNILYDVPITSAGNGAYSANFHVTVSDGDVLNGAGSLAMGSKTLSTELANGLNYTYTGGTWSQATTVPTVSGGTMALSGEGTWTFTVASSAILTFAPTANAVTYNLGGGSFTGTLDLRNTHGTRTITVELPAGTSYTTANNTGAAITVTTPAVYQSVTLTGLAVGSRVQIYDTTSSTELANATATGGNIVFSGGGTVATWTDPTPAAATRAIRVRVAYVDGTATPPVAGSAKLFIEANIGTCATSGAGKDVTYVVSQEDDQVYIDNGFNGKTVYDAGEITFTDSSPDVVNIDVAANTVSLKSIYAAWCWYAFTSAGIAVDIDYIDAIDTANYRYSNLVIKNTSSPSVPLEVTGGYAVDAVTRASIDIVDTTGGTLIFAPDHVVAYATGSGVTPTDITDIAAASATAVLSAATSAPIASNVKKVNDTTVTGSGTSGDPWGP